MDALFCVTRLDSKEEITNLSRVQVLSFLVTKKIQSDALITDSANSPAIPLYQHKDFQFLFAMNETDTRWTLLKKHENHFVQTDEYSTKGLQKLLTEGVISDQDFVWKSSFQSWQRISVCSEFYTKPSAVVEDLMDQMSMNYSSDMAHSVRQKTVFYKRKSIPFYTWSKWGK